MEILDLINHGSRQLKNKKIFSHKLDSEILLSKVLNKTREELLINLNKKIDPTKINYFNRLISRRSLREPIAYILEEKEFWSKNFLVNKNTLIPRPETELMVEKIVKIFEKKKIYILDIGTGTGCILLSLLSELKTSKGIGIDISKKAIEIARSNSKKHELNHRTKFFRRSLSEIYHRKFDLIVSNPPYLSKQELENTSYEIKKYEPFIALDGGEDGLDFYRDFSKKINDIMNLNSYLIIEIGERQLSDCIDIFSLSELNFHKKTQDLQKKDRILIYSKL